MRPTAAPANASRRLKYILSSSANLTYPWPEPTPEELAAEEKRRQKRIRDHEKYLRRRNARKRSLRGRSRRVSRMRWCASAAERPSTPSAPTQSSVRPPADSGSTASKSGNFRRRIQYPSRTCGNQQNRITPNAAACRQGQALFLCPDMEVAILTLFETVKNSITVKQPPEHYGCKVNRGDMICLPLP